MSKIMSLVLSKGTVIATIAILMLAAFSATNVFAAGSTTTAPSTQAVTLNLEKNWKVESSTLHNDVLILGRFDRLIDNQSGTHREVRFSPLAYRNFSVMLNKANAIVSTHAGFDAKGVVTDQGKATQSINDLNRYLSQLRGDFVYRLRNI